MKSFYLSLFGLCLINFTNAQVHNWSFGIGGTASESIQAIADGGNGTTVITGAYGSQNFDFDPSAGQSEISPVGGYDIFLAKYDNDSLLWVRSLAGTGFSSSGDLAILANGDILVTGNINGVVNFDPNGTYELDAGTGSDAYVARYDSDGNFISAFAFEGSGQTSGAAIEVDGSGNIYVSGLLSDSADFDPGAGTTFINNSTGGFYLAKYTSAGAFQWAIPVTGVGGTDVKDLQVTPDGTAYLTGLFQQTVDLDPGPGTDNFTADGVDAYVMKVNSAGAYQWGRVFTGNNNQVTWGLGFEAGISGVTPDAVYVCGRFSSEIDLDPTAGTEIIPSPTNSTAFVTKLDGDGAYEWGRYITNQGDGKFLDVEASFGAVRLAGVFSGTITLPDNSTIFSTGGGDIFYAEYDEQGDYQDHMIFGGPSNEDLFSGAAIMGPFSLRFGGVYYGTIDFAPGQDTLSGPTSQGNEDVFLAEYIFPVTPSVSELEAGIVQLFPNPAQDEVIAKCESGWSVYTLIDHTGRIVSRANNSGNNRIDLSGLTEGMYVLRMVNNDGDVSVGRLIKNR